MRRVTKMDDRMRVSDADREQVAARLREHFAEGRLSSEELDERITTALNAKTFGDLRGLMADLPEPETAAPPGGQVPPWVGRPMPRFRRGPRLLPVALILLFAALILPGTGFVFFTFLKALLLVWLVMCLVGVFAAARFRRNARRHWQSSDRDHWRHNHWDR